MSPGFDDEKHRRLTGPGRLPRPIEYSRRHAIIRYAAPPMAIRASCARFLILGASPLTRHLTRRKRPLPSAAIMTRLSPPANDQHRNIISYLSFILGQFRSIVEAAIIEIVHRTRMNATSIYWRFLRRTARSRHRRRWRFGSTGPGKYGADAPSPSGSRNDRQQNV